MTETGNPDLQTKLPSQVENQPDPFLQLSTERSYGGGAIALLGVVAALILGVVLYGLNGSNSGTEPRTTVAANSPAAPPAAPAPAAKNSPAASGHAAAAPAAPNPTAQQKGPGSNP